MLMLGFFKNQTTIFVIKYTKSFTLSKHLNFKKLNLANKKYFLEWSQKILVVPNKNISQA